MLPGMKKQFSLAFALAVATAPMAPGAAILQTVQAGPYKAQLTHGYDPAPADKDCYDYTNLTVWKVEEEGGQTQVGRHKVCAIGTLAAFTSQDHAEFVMERPGDGTSDAALYRYDPQTDTLYFHNFNARHVVVDGVEGNVLTLRTQNKTPDTDRSHGRNPDTLNTYHWPMGEEPQKTGN